MPARFRGVDVRFSAYIWGMEKAFLLGGLLAIVVTDCDRGQAAASPAAPSSETARKRDLYVQIARTPCYGRCPIDKVEAYGDGKVRYTGERFVPRLGTYTRQLTPDEMKKLEQMLRESAFEKYDTLYDNPGISDLPSLVLMYQLDGKSQRITCRTGCPPDLPGKIERIRAFLADEGNFQMEKGPETEETIQDSHD
jgi:hypothetical protein